MFSIVITVIAIALVAIIALATVYYGGLQWTKGADSATTSRVLNEGSQISGALELYRADHGDFPTGTSQEIQTTLVSQNYLKTIPPGAWDLRTDFAVRTDLTQSACLSINQKLGVQSVPTCGDPAYTARSICCQVSP